VLLHRLERERAVEQVDAVHHGDLLQPLPGVVVPVRQPVDDQLVAGFVAQAERLDGDPLDVEGVIADGPQPPEDLRERGGPVVLGPEEQADQVPGQYDLPWVSRIAAGGGPAGRARTTSRGECRAPTSRVRAVSPSR